MPRTCHSSRVRQTATPDRRGKSMTVSMYKISVPIFVQFLTSLAAVLDKAAAHCEAKKIEPAALLNTRLFPGYVSPAAPGARRNRSCRQRNARGLPAPSRSRSPIPKRASRISRTHRQGNRFRQRLQSRADRRQRGQGDQDHFPSGATRDFTGQSLLLNNSLPNFYFHCTTAYDILRHCGVELGKRDFMGTPVSS